jgi:hypothetical protein
MLACSSTLNRPPRKMTDALIDDTTVVRKSTGNVA